ALIAVALAAFHRPSEPRDATPVSWRLRVGGLAICGAVGAALAVGALATPARHWDGAATWETKAVFLTRAPTVDQPLFAHPGVVYEPSPDYPLLQPICVALGNRLLGDGAGRGFFVLTFVLLVGWTHLTVRARAERAWLAVVAAVAVAT